MRLLLLLFLSCALSACGKNAREPIGFFEPLGQIARFEGHVQFAQVTPRSPDQLEDVLKIADDAHMQIDLLLGPVIADPRDPLTVATNYTDRSGVTHRKFFPPRAFQKLVTIASDTEIAARLAPLIAVAKEWPGVVRYAFLPDEPVINIFYDWLITKYK